MWCCEVVNVDMRKNARKDDSLAKCLLETQILDIESVDVI